MLAFIIFYIFASCIYSGPALSEEFKTFRKDGRLEFMNYDGTVCASIDLEIADTSEAIAKGLMWRRYIDDTVGMLFVYDKADGRVFWMRNTPVSLDIIFVSEKGQIINIAKRTKPLSDTEYLSKAPAKYVIEVRSGFSERHGIEEGIRIRWRRN